MGGALSRLFGNKRRETKDSSSSLNHSLESSVEDLRQEANDLYAEAKKLSSLSQMAYQRGDKEQAFELSQRKKKTFDAAERKNREAAAATVAEKNQSRNLFELDLHGLYVEEALQVLDGRLARLSNMIIGDCRQLNLVIITGRGNNSANKVAKIKPAVCQHLARMGMNYTENSPNDGCITAHITLSATRKEETFICCFL